MTKEIAFLIWLYDRELEKLSEGNEIESFECSHVREKFMEFFDINEQISQSGINQ